jgi:hypothetical protein
MSDLYTHTWPCRSRAAARPEIVTIGCLGSFFRSKASPHSYGKVSLRRKCCYCAGAPCACICAMALRTAATRGPSGASFKYVWNSAIARLS